jgi:hypothetical protein
VPGEGPSSVRKFALGVIFSGKMSFVQICLNQSRLCKQFQSGKENKWKFVNIFSPLFYKNIKHISQNITADKIGF